MVRRIRKLNLPKSFKIRGLIVPLILILLGLWSFNRLRVFITESPYFKIDKVEIAIIGKASLTDRTVRELLAIQKGKSIFEVDLKAARDGILLRYPEIKALVINRAFPNKLILKIRPRRPVAQVAISSGFYLIDGEGVLLPIMRGLVFEDFPIIRGINKRLSMMDVGKRYDYLGLKRALALLRVINYMKFSQEHQIHMIDISDEKNLSLYIEDGIEIKIGGEKFGERLNRFNKTFDAGKVDKTRIGYVDLRFGDVIIGPK